MTAPDWSSLPADLVNHVADCLLATNDLDCYADLRAVCHHWRSVTADPSSNQHDPRFRPTGWVMLDEHRPSAASAITGDGAVFFVNTSTGRFLRRSLPFLHDHDKYVFITSTTDGLLVLAAREPPHAVRVLNPLTSSLIRFAAALPRYPGPRLTADVVGSSSTLFLVSVSTSLVYWANPKSESFSVEEYRGHCPASRLPQIAAAVDREHGSISSAKNIFDHLRSEEAEGWRCYAVVVAGGDMLAVLKWPRGIDVFKIDAAGNMMERVKSIGSQALFLGVRCLAVDADCFPNIEPNCAYFQLIDDFGQRNIYKYNIGTNGDEEEPELVSVAIDYYVGYLRRCYRPCTDTVTQLLSKYTMDIPRHPLPPGRCISYVDRGRFVGGYVEVDRYEDYTDYVENPYEGYGFDEA